MKKPLQLKQVLAALLTIAALASGLTAQATVQTGIMMQGLARTVNNETRFAFVIQSDWGGDQITNQTGSSYTFSNATMIHGTVDVTLNGKLNFQVGTAFADVITGNSFTVTIESSSLWFYGATIQTKNGTNVSGCSTTVSSNKHTLTLTIPSGKTFGAIIVDYVDNPPMTNSNTTVTVPAGDYWVSNSSHKPKPEPTVVYGQTTLVKDTDYTLSWSNNSSAGTGTVTVTGIGNYAGSATSTFPIRWARYYVHFDKNHDDATGTMSDQQFTYNTAQALTANTFSRAGYSFDGWSTTSNGAVTYTDGQSVSNLTAEDGQTVTLYAQWERLERYYTFDSTTGVLALLWGEFNKDNKWGSEVTPSAVTSVTATDEVSFTGDCNSLFYNFNHCTSMDLTDVNTVSVTNMYRMFRECSNLQSLDLSGWNTAKVTNMSYMFNRCSGLQSLNVSDWSTANVTDMSSMFYGCSGLQSLNVSDWNTANVTSMIYMFEGCSSLQSLNISGWNTANVTNMYALFYGCSGLPSLDLSGWNTARVTDMSYMFYDCTNLATIYVGEDWSTDEVDFSYDMFDGCTSLVGGMGTTYDANHTDVNYAHIDGGPDNPGYLSRLRYTFDSTTGVLALLWGEFNASNKWGSEVTPSAVTSVTATDEVSFTGDCNSLFYNFNHCTSMDLTDVNTVSVTNMYRMFRECSNLQSLDLSGWNTAKVTNMSYMFNRCSGLQSLNVSDWSTANVTDMSSMFYDCSGLQSLNISDWNTANVTSMIYMFKGCWGLQSLNVSGWSTANVTNMIYMFEGCSGLQSLDLSGWNTANVTNMSGMFQVCRNLATIYVGEGWSTSRVTSSNFMFTGCTSLVGGMGTAYNSNHTDKAYACIDRGSERPGYFTEGFTKEIAGYGNDENPGGYYLIASPVGTVNPENVGNMTANAFDLYRFNQSADLEWENWKAEGNNYHFDLEVGKGYLYANSEDVTLTFTGTLVEGDTYEVTLAKDNGATFAGWNLVGNPFTKTAYVMGDVAFYTMNETGSELEACTSLTSIAPMEGVFVLAEADVETLTFTTEEPSKKGEMLALNLCGGGVSTLRQAQGPRTAILDRAIVRFDDGGVLPKFQIRKDNTKVYIPMDGKEYAVVNMGRDAARHVSTNEIPVNFKAAENGEYTIAVNAEGVMLNYLHLIDNLTGTDADLLHPNAVIAGEDPQSPTPAMTAEGKGYTFEAKTTDYESRFRLVFSASADANGDNEAFAFVNNGNIIITDVETCHGASLQIVDVMGRIVVQGDAMNRVSTGGMTPGVYVLCLINGDMIRTQKIVVK